MDALVSTRLVLFIIISGPLSSKLIDVFGSKATAISGSIILCLGLVISAFASDVWSLYITFGVITGQFVSAIHCKRLLSECITVKLLPQMKAFEFAVYV